MPKIDPAKFLIVGAILAMAALIVLAVASLGLTVPWHGLLAALRSGEMRYALGFTAITSAVSTALVILAAIPTAYGFARLRFPGKRVVQSIIYLPGAFPQIVLGLCLLLFFSHPAPMAVLGPLGIDLVFTKAGVVAAQFFTAFPAAVQVLKSTFDHIDPKLEFVSRSLGLSRARTFLRVSIPLARTGLFAAASISFARCAGAFGAVLVLAGGVRMHTETLPIALYLNLSYGNLEMAVAAGLLLVLISFAGIYAIEKLRGDS